MTHLEMFYLIVLILFLYYLLIYFFFYNNLSITLSERAEILGKGHQWSGAGVVIWTLHSSDQEVEL